MQCLKDGIYGIYSDDDYAGSDRNRPEFKRMIADAEAHKFDIVLCKTQSRFTRELELVEKYIHGLFPQWGIRFVSIVDNADTDVKGNKKSRQINGLVNEWYLEDMSENIRSVLTNRRQNGLYIGAFACYGYVKDPNQKGHLLIDDEAAEVVREIFNLYSQGYGCSAISHILNDRGIPNPTMYKHSKGMKFHQHWDKNSGLWRFRTVAGILDNEMYIGNMVQGKWRNVSYKSKKHRLVPKEEWIKVENTHEPIVSKELFFKVRQMRRDRTRPSGDGKIGLFAGKVRCMTCGYTMKSTKSAGKHYYICSTRSLKHEYCIGAFISVQKLEQIVISEFNKLSEQYLDTDVLADKIHISDSLPERKRKLASDISGLEHKIEEMNAAIRDLYLDKVKGVITEHDYIFMSRDFTNERNRIGERLREAREKLEELEVKIAAGDNKAEIIKRYTNIDHLTREMVDIMIDYILIGRREKGEKLPPIEIHWNF